MIMYADIVFLTNWAADSAILMATARIHRQRPSHARVALSAALGAVYAAAMFAADLPMLYTFGAKLAVSALMVTLAFGYGNLTRWTKHMGTFYVVNFAAAGGVIGLAYMWRVADPWKGAVALADGGALLLEWRLQLGVLAIFFVLSIWLYRGVAANKRDLDRLASSLVQVRVAVGIESRTCRGLVDTGNRLYEPLTRIPVMIMEADMWRDLLPHDWPDRLQSESPDLLIGELDERSDEHFALRDRLRLVPYRGVNGDARLLLAIRPDVVEILLPDGRAVRETRVLVGLDGGRLSPDGAYRAIVHPDLADSDKDTAQGEGKGAASETEASPVTGQTA